MARSPQQNKYPVGESVNPHKLYTEFSPIPPCIMNCHVLTQTEKLLWGQLAKHSGNDGKCYPSHETLAKELDVSISVVETSLRKLKGEGFIGIIRRKHLSNIYVFFRHEIFEKQDPLKTAGLNEQDPLKMNLRPIENNDTPPLKTMGKKKHVKETIKDEDRNSSSSNFYSLGKSTLTPKRIVEYWNLHFKDEPIGATITLTTKREKYLLARIKELPTLKEWRELFTTIKEERRFLLGENERGWKMSFDWLMKDDAQIIKIREGEYRKILSKEEKEEEEARKEAAREEVRRSREAREYAEARDTECNDFLQKFKPVISSDIYDETYYMEDEETHDMILRPEFKQLQHDYLRFEIEVRNERAKGKTIAELEEMFPVKKIEK